MYHVQAPDKLHKNWVISFLFQLLKVRIKERELDINIDKVVILSDLVASPPTLASPLSTPPYLGLYQYLSHPPYIV
jgi:hypothetical protein